MNSAKRGLDLFWSLLCQLLWDVDAVGAIPGRVGAASGGTPTVISPIRTPSDTPITLARRRPPPNVEPITDTSFGSSTTRLLEPEFLPMVWCADKDGEFSSQGLGIQRMWRTRSTEFLGASG